MILFRFRSFAEHVFESQLAFRPSVVAPTLEVALYSGWELLAHARFRKASNRASYARLVEFTVVQAETPSHAGQRNHISTVE